MTKQIELDTSIFKITSSTPYNDKTKFYRMECNSWVNIIPITQDKKMILVKQYRYGVDSETWEIPAGKVEDHDTPIEAAKRELKEETGYGNGTWMELGWSHPNTAIQNNRSYSFLVENVEKIDRICNDAHEKTEVIFVNLASMYELVATKKITHSLSINAFFMYCLHKKLLLDA